MPYIPIRLRSEVERALEQLSTVAKVARVASALWTNVSCASVVAKYIRVASALHIEVRA
jgi:ribonuclease HII